MPSDNSSSGTFKDWMSSINPFKHQNEHSQRTVIAFKVWTALSWLLVVVTSISYAMEKPRAHKHYDTIWGQNRQHLTPFTLNGVIISLYWLALFILQIGYCWHLYASNSTYVNAAANVGSHFIAHNLLFFGFLHLWVRGHFWWAELLLIINFLNLSSAYFRHSTTPRFIHIPVVSGPLAWNFVALYWCGAVMFHAHNLAARIIANVAIWGILVYGMFFLVAFKDYTMGFELSILTAALGVGQFLIKVVSLQWIFAFVIMAALFLFSIPVAFPAMFGQRNLGRGRIVTEDRERAPLLADE